MEEGGRTSYVAKEKLKPDLFGDDETVAGFFSWRLPLVVSMNLSGRIPSNFNH